MSVIKMMSRIVDPKSIAAKKHKAKGNIDPENISTELHALHDHTYGITR